MREKGKGESYPHRIDHGVDRVICTEERASRAIAGSERAANK